MDALFFEAGGAPMSVEVDDHNDATGFHGPLDSPFHEPAEHTRFSFPPLAPASNNNNNNNSSSGRRDKRDDDGDEDDDDEDDDESMNREDERKGKSRGRSLSTGGEQAGIAPELLAHHSLGRHRLQRSASASVLSTPFARGRSSSLVVQNPSSPIRHPRAMSPSPQMLGRQRSASVSESASSAVPISVAGTVAAAVASVAAAFEAYDAAPSPLPSSRLVDMRVVEGKKPAYRLTPFYFYEQQKQQQQQQQQQQRQQQLQKRRNSTGPTQHRLAVRAHAQQQRPRSGSVPAVVVAMHLEDDAASATSDSSAVPVAAVPVRAALDQRDLVTNDMIAALWKSNNLNGKFPERNGGVVNVGALMQAVSRAVGDRSASSSSGSSSSSSSSSKHPACALTAKQWIGVAASIGFPNPGKTFSNKLRRFFIKSVAPFEAQLLADARLARARRTKDAVLLRAQPVYGAAVAANVLDAPQAPSATASQRPSRPSTVMRAYDLDGRTTPTMSTASTPASSPQSVTSSPPGLLMASPSSSPMSRKRKFSFERQQQQHHQSSRDEDEPIEKRLKTWHTPTSSVASLDDPPAPGRGRFRHMVFASRQSGAKLHAQRWIDLQRRGENARLYLLTRGAVHPLTLERQFTLADDHGRRHVVRLSSMHWCSCSTGSNNKASELCEHILFVLHRVLRVPRDHPTTGQRIVSRAALARIYADAPTDPAQSLVAGELHKAAFSRLVGEAGELHGAAFSKLVGDIDNASANDCDSISSASSSPTPSVLSGGPPPSVAAAGAASGGGSVKAVVRKSTRHGKAECPVCLQQLGLSGGLVYCRAKCGTNFHERCFRIYSRHARCPTASPVRASHRATAVTGAVGRDEVVAAVRVEAVVASAVKPEDLVRGDESCPLCRVPWAKEDDHFAAFPPLGDEESVLLSPQHRSKRAQLRKDQSRRNNAGDGDSDQENDERDEADMMRHLLLDDKQAHASSKKHRKPSPRFKELLLGADELDDDNGELEIESLLRRQRTTSLHMELDELA